MPGTDRIGHGHRMTPSSSEAIGPETAERLSAGLHRCFAEFVVDDGLFADNAFFDLLPPRWRFQLEGPGDDFASPLQSIAQGRVEVDVIRTIPTASGLVTEHVETQHTPNGVMTARRHHLCEVADGRITAVTIYGNGACDAELRVRHAAEAPMVRP